VGGKGKGAWKGCGGGSVNGGEVGWIKRGEGGKGASILAFRSRISVRSSLGIDCDLVGWRSLYSDIADLRA